MTTNPLAQAIRSAVRMNNDIGDLFARIGTSEHPRGAILIAYRNARRAMPAALKETNRVMAVREVLQGLRTAVLAGARTIIGQAVQLGQDEATRQLGFYDITPSVVPVSLYSQVDSAIKAVAGYLDAQVLTIQAILATDGDAGLITGDGERLGVLRPGDITAAAGFWTASLVWEAFSQMVSAASRDVEFKKMAVAAIDNRTTDCCLRVNGQVVLLSDKFHLTGTPRYADYLDWSPFHGWCRTSGVLYLPEYDDGLSAAMQDAAQVVLDERSRGIRKDRNPADSFS